ncbi:MAG: hypothetical protein QM773_20105 [Hyphomonadaceae bacterium]
MKSVLAAVLAAVTLSACETVNTWPTKEELATFAPDSGNSLVVLSATDNFGCGRTSLAFLDVDTKARFDRTISTGEPAAAVVKPGNYHLYYGNCFSAVGDLQGIMYWFDSVEVKPNEVVYLGTFNMDVITVTSQAGILDNIFTLGLTAITGAASQYPVYEMRDETDRIRTKLREQFPQFADAMTTRLPPTILSREDFATAFRNAYAPRPDGSRPTDEEARGRLDGEIDKAIEASLARYLAAHPERTKDNPPKPAASPSP